jgi:LysM repeat protein
MSFYKTKFELCPRLKFGVKRGVSHNQKFKIFTVIFLSLAAILGINAARLVLKSSTSENKNPPQVLGAADTKDTNLLEFAEYKVQKGDTLFNISQKYNINWATLATLNNLKSPFVLKPGQIVKIPK